MNIIDTTNSKPFYYLEKDKQCLHIETDLLFNL